MDLRPELGRAGNRHIQRECSRRREGDGSVEPKLAEASGWGESQDARQRGSSARLFGRTTKRRRDGGISDQIRGPWVAQNAAGTLSWTRGSEFVWGFGSRSGPGSDRSGGVAKGVLGRRSAGGRWSWFRGASWRRRKLMLEGAGSPLCPEVHMTTWFRPPAEEMVCSSGARDASCAPTTATVSSGCLFVAGFLPCRRYVWIASRSLISSLEPTRNCDPRKVCSPRFFFLEAEKRPTLPHADPGAAAPSAVCRVHFGRAPPSTGANCAGLTAQGYAAAESSTGSTGKYCVGSVEVASRAHCTVCKVLVLRTYRNGAASHAGHQNDAAKFPVRRLFRRLLAAVGVAQLKSRRAKPGL